MKAKVLIVDDHPAIRAGVKHALSKVDGLQVVGEAVDGNEALQLAVSLAPDLVVMDLHLPGMSGIYAGRKLLEIQKDTKIIIFTGDISSEQVDSALGSGILGYVTKESALEELPQAVEAVMAGKFYVSTGAGSQIMAPHTQNLSETFKARAAMLTEREIELLRLVSEGLRNKEIAERLGVSNKAVEISRSRLMKKLACSTPAELVRYSVRQGIVPL